jgi:hypothetical protein
MPLNMERCARHCDAVTTSLGQLALGKIGQTIENGMLRVTNQAVKNTQMRGEDPN